jgi:predicted nuclease of predicted toxin-antitoxin system
MRFLVDENLPTDVAELLRGEGHDVSYLPHTAHRGDSDLEVWRLAVRERRVILTRDLDFPMPESPSPPGLILVRVPDTFTRKQIERVMSEFMASEAFQQVVGTITVSSVSSLTSRPRATSPKPSTGWSRGWSAATSARRSSA